MSVKNKSWPRLARRAGMLHRLLGSLSVQQWSQNILKADPAVNGLKHHFTRSFIQKIYGQPNKSKKMINDDS